MDIAALEALKNEGNGFFRLKQFVDAVRVYTTALDRIESCSNGLQDVTVTAQLDAAIRLNRAWALLEMDDDKRVSAAERDCSTVLVRDPTCVKALYRRALARERLGDIKGAIADANSMKALEPANPSADPLVARLRSLVADETVGDDELAIKLDHISIVEVPDTQAKEETEAQVFVLKGQAEAAWRALQEEESTLRRSVATPAPKKSRRLPYPVNGSAVDKQSPVKGEISSKTDVLWALLGEEEASTVVRARSHSARQ